MLIHDAESVQIEVQVVPRASRLRFGPRVGDRLKIQIPAAPVDGAANDALQRALADALDLPRRAVEVVHGHTGRRKTIRLFAADAEARQRILDKVQTWSQS